jgi:hypothetical protein
MYLIHKVKEIVYGYDAIGDYDPDKSLIQVPECHKITILKNKYIGNNLKSGKKTKFSKHKMIELIYKDFISIAERDRY